MLELDAMVVCKWKKECKVSVGGVGQVEKAEKEAEPSVSLLVCGNARVSSLSALTQARSVRSGVRLTLSFYRLPI